MATRREELVAVAARLFAERGYHGTSMADLAEAMGLQKGSLYSLTESKQELLVVITRDGAASFHAALDAVPDGEPLERIRLALRAHLGVVAGQVERRDGLHARVAVPRRAGADGLPGGAPPLRGALARALLQDAAERGALRSDLDIEAAVLLVLSAANWAYTWMRPGANTDELADRFFATLLDGVRGYATRPS